MAQKLRENYVFNNNQSHLSITVKINSSIAIFSVYVSIEVGAQYVHLHNIVCPYHSHHILDLFTAFQEHLLVVRKSLLYRIGR